jgi:hypothetical protein
MVAEAGLATVDLVGHLGARPQWRMLVMNQRTLLAPLRRGSGSGCRERDVRASPGQTAASGAVHIIRRALCIERAVA